MGFPLNIQKRQCIVENGAAGMGKRKARAVQEQPTEGVMEGTLDGDGDGAWEDDGEGSHAEIMR